MMKSKGASGSQRREVTRGRWHKHVAAQRASGQTQVTYCRAQGLDPSYFSMWKRKPRGAGSGSEPAGEPIDPIGAAGGEDGARVDRTRRIDGGTDIDAPDA